MTHTVQSSDDYWMQPEVIVNASSMASELLFHSVNTYHFLLIIYHADT